MADATDVLRGLAARHLPADLLSQADSAGLAALTRGLRHRGGRGGEAPLRDRHGPGAVAEPGNDARSPSCPPRHDDLRPRLAAGALGRADPVPGARGGGCGRRRHRDRERGGGRGFGRRRRADAGAEARRARRNRLPGWGGDGRAWRSGRGGQRPRCRGRVRGGGRSRAAPRASAGRGCAAGHGRRGDRGLPACLLGGDAARGGARGGARMSDLLLRSGEWAQVTPESAGWSHLFFGVRRAPFATARSDVEIALVPLSGRCRVRASGETWELGGRESVFGGMPWALYLPRDTAYEL